MNGDPESLTLTLAERDTAVLTFRDGSRVRVRCVAFGTDAIRLWLEMPCEDAGGAPSALAEVNVEDLVAGDEPIDVDFGEHGLIRIDLVAATTESATLQFFAGEGCSVVGRMSNRDEPREP